MAKVLVFQSGGPTTVLNASLSAVVSEARLAFDGVLGSRRGLEGVLSGNVLDLSALTDERLERLARTPSAALGTSRFRPDDGQIDDILDTLQRIDVEGVVAIGGNDTADTAARLSDRARQRRIELRVIGLPKTIDNDLARTDHCLGYPSAARCLAVLTRDALYDSIATANLYPVKVIEVMGRNAGWLAASCALAVPRGLPSPLLCLPERPYDDPDGLLQSIQSRIDSGGLAIVVAPETMRWSNGAHIAGSEPEWIDPFGHPYYASSGQALVRLCSQRLGVRARLDKPGTQTRSAMHLASPVDLDEAAGCGRFAVRALAEDETGQCVVIERAGDAPYRSRLGLAPLEEIANVERRLPDAMLDTSGAGVTRAFHDYALPLLGDPLDEYESLE